MNDDYFSRGHFFSRKIFKFYEDGLRYVPVFLMFCHFCGVLHFHSNPHEIILDTKGNKPCILFFYFMTYVFPLLFMIPASHFFRLCWVFRIPFYYIIGINFIHVAYLSLLIRNEMYYADISLISITAYFYYNFASITNFIQLQSTHIIQFLNFNAYENRKSSGRRTRLRLTTPAYRHMRHDR